AAVACTPAGGDLVLLEDGVPRLVQPLAPAADAAAAWERVAAALRAKEEDGRALGSVAILGSGADAAALRDAALADETYGGRVTRATETEEIPAEALLALGAALAGSASPVLLPEALIRDRARRARRRTVAMASGAFALAMLSAGLHLHGINREIEQVEARRRQIATQVRHAREARANVEGVRTRLEAIAALEKESNGWTEDIAALARALPDSAHLRTLSADSTGLRLAGIARSASSVVPALEASPAFERVSLAAPVRWQQGDPGERFDVAAALQPGRRVRTPAARPPSPAPPPSSSADAVPGGSEGAPGGDGQKEPRQ
ncbi:MAG TPA: PilN domain-containing protein, partial [Longimicrobium sp.]|nr:PilN domain-containing protein [Longimicrobium sp.]